MARVYLDSCVVIYLLEGPEDLSRKVQESLRPIQGAAQTACVSDLTRLECRVGPMKKGDESVLRQFDEFFAARDVEKIPLGAAEFDLATRIRAAHGTKTPDALHLAAAMLGECEEFWTNDSRLKAAARGRLQIRIFS